MQSPPSQSDPVKKQEDDEKPEKRDVKPLPKTLNRVPRKCGVDPFTLPVSDYVQHILRKKGACVSQ